MNIFFIYGNHPGKTVATILLIIIGIITLLKFQTLEIPTLQAAFELLFSEQDKTTLYLTWFLNLLSAGGIAMVGLLWIKDFGHHSYNLDATVNAIVCIITGLLMIVFSMEFAMYLFNSLLGLVLIILIVLGIAYSDSSGNKKSYR